MNSVSRNVLSGFLAVLFIAVSITGVMMYFKIRIFSSETIHIWIGFLFVLISLLHLVKNWSGFLSYFKKSSTFGAISAGFFLVALFVIVPLFGPQDKGINPKGAMINALMNAPIEKIAVFLDMDGALMIKRLSDQKQIMVSPKQSVSEIAKANHKNNDEILGVLFQK